MSADTLENVCENMLTHVHKVIHLVVSNLSKGGEIRVEKVLFTVTGRWTGASVQLARCGVASVE